MAKRTTLQLWTGSGWEDLFPKTRSDMVILGNGENNLEHRLNMVEAVARGAQQSLSFENYAELVEYIKGLGANDLSVGQNMYIKELNVPDVWIYIANKDWTNYPFNGNEAFINGLNSENGVHVGHYVLAALETGKSVLTNQASSQVLVGGVHQSVWNADTKLDKTTVTSEMLLTQKVDGSTDKLGFDIAAKPYYIVRRDAKGDVLVNDTPSSTSAAVNQKYVDEAVANAGGGGSVDLSEYVKKSQFSSSYGVYISNGNVSVYAATETDISTGTNKYKPITPIRVDFLVKKGITASKLTLSDTEKAKAQEWLGISGGGLYKHIFYWEDEYGDACQLELFTTRSTRYDLVEDDTTPWTQMLSETISAKIYFNGFEDEFSAVVSLYATEGDSDNPEYDMVVGLDVYYYYYSNKRLLEVSNIMGQPEFSYTVKKA